MSRTKRNPLYEEVTVQLGMRQKDVVTQNLGLQNL